MAKLNDLAAGVYVCWRTASRVLSAEKKMCENPMDYFGTVQCVAAAAVTVK